MFNINIVATWSWVDNDCRSQGKDWTLSMQTKTHYTLYNLFLPWGMPSLSNLWPPITNLSQKQKQCSIVALNSFTAVGLFGGEDAVGTTQWRTGFIPELTERVTCNKVLWQMLSELFNSTSQVIPASKLPSLELSPTAPTRKAAKDNQKSAEMGPGGICFFPAVWILFTFCHWLPTSS